MSHKLSQSIFPALMPMPAAGVVWGERRTDLLGAAPD
jgi:hypothetical protein